MRPEGVMVEVAAVVFTYFSNITSPSDNPPRNRGAPSSYWGLLPIPPSGNKTKERAKGGMKEICATDERKGTSQGEPGPPLLPPPPEGKAQPSPSPTPPSSSEGTKRISLPTFVSLRKLSTAGVALSSSKSRLTEGAQGCFHPHAFPTLSTSLCSAWSSLGTGRKGGGGAVTPRCHTTNYRSTGRRWPSRPMEA